MPGRSNVKERKLAYHTTLNKAICRMIEYNIELMGGKLDYPLEKDKKSQYNGKKTNKKSRKSGSVYKRNPLKDIGVMSRKKKSIEMDSVGKHNPLNAKGVRSRKKTQTGGVGSSQGSESPESDGSRGRRSGDGSRGRRSVDGSRGSSRDRHHRNRSRTPSRGRRGHDDYRVPEMGVNVRTAWDIGITIGIMSLIMGLGKNVLLKTLLPYIVRGLEYVYGIDPEHRDRSLAHLGFPRPCAGSGYLRNMLLTGIGFQEHTCEDIDRMYTAAFRDEIGRFVRTVSLITGSNDVDMSYIVQGINALVFAIILESVRRVPVYARIAGRVPLTMGRVVGSTISTGTRMTGSTIATIGRTGYNTAYQGTCLATRMMFWLVDLTFLLDTNSELYQEGSRRFIAHRGFVQFCKAGAHFTVDQFKRLYKLIKRNLSSAPVATAEFGTTPEEMVALGGLRQMHEGAVEFYRWNPETEEIGSETEEIGSQERLPQGVHPRLPQGVLTRQIGVSDLPEIDVSDLPDGKLLEAALTTGPDDQLRFKGLEYDRILKRGDNTDPSERSGRKRLVLRKSLEQLHRPSHPSPRERVATKKPLDELAKQILEDPRVVKKFDLREFVMRKMLDTTQQFTMDEQERLANTVIRNLRTNTDPSEEDIIAEINDVVMEHNLQHEDIDWEGW